MAVLEVDVDVAYKKDAKCVFVVITDRGSARYLVVETRHSEIKLQGIIDKVVKKLEDEDEEVSIKTVLYRLQKLGIIKAVPTRDTYCMAITRHIPEQELPGDLQVG